MASPAKPPKPKLAFWVHQAVEYCVGVLLIMQALQLADPAGPLAAGIAVIVLAATADGPLAAFHWVPRPVHRVLDVAVAVLCVVAAVVFRDQLGTFGLVFLVVAALTLVFLVLRTNYRPKPPRASRAARFAEGAAQGSVKAEDVGRAAGRAVGKGVNAFRRRPPPAGNGSASPPPAP